MRRCVASWTLSMCRVRSSRISAIGRNSSSLRICPRSRSARSLTPTRSVRGLDVAHALLCAGHGEENTPREQPIEQQELGGVPGAWHAAVGAQVGLVGADAAQDGRPRRPARLGQRAGGEQSRGHVGTLDAATEGEEQPGFIAARRRLDDADGQRRALAHPAEKLVHLVARNLAGHPCPRGVEHFPEFGRNDFARPAGVLARGIQRVGDGCGLGAIDGEDIEDIRARERGILRRHSAPMTLSRDRQARSSSIHGSSSSNCKCTSRMRAVPSLRSM